MSCCRPRSWVRSASNVATDPGKIPDAKDDARVGRELLKLVASGKRVGRLRFGSEDGLPVWIKYLSAGTRRPEISLLVDGEPSRFRGRCLPVGAGSLDECESLEREARLPAGSLDLTIPSWCENSLQLVRLLGFDEHMNLCFRPTKPWDSQRDL